jgi:hypothetical protein
MSAALDDFVAGRPTYPSGTVFIASDLEWSGNSIAERARENKPIVVVYPDGEERFLVPSPHPREGAGVVERLRLRLRRRFG